MVGERRFELPIRPPHPLGGVTKSCSLFVATSPSWSEPSACFGTSPTNISIQTRGKEMVGERRFELPASWSRTKRATKLRYSPTKT
jgi:hypothetical protein